MINRQQLFFDLLQCLEGGDQNRGISLSLEGASWDFEVRDLEDVLKSFLFEMPTLRNSLDLAEKDVETLQEQIAGETLETKPPRWEYRFLASMYKANNERLETQLNEKGRDGWELVNIEFGHGRAIFKRMLNE